MLPELPPAALGAVIAAVITSTLAFVGIMVGKDQKTSEFRQAWIEGLRTDVSEYLSAAWSIWREVKHGDANKPMWERVRDHATEEARLATRINLRLNFREQPSKDLDDKIKALTKSIQGWQATSFEDIKTASDEVEKATSIILKTEWERVKRGELGYFITKWLVLLAIPIGVLTVAFVLLNAPAGPQANTAAKAGSSAKPSVQQDQASPPQR